MQIYTPENTRGPSLQRFFPEGGGSVAYRWQTSGLLLAATYCAQRLVAYRAIVSIIQLNAWLVIICLCI